MEQYAKYLRKSRFDRDYAELSVEETLKRHETILDKMAGDRGYHIAKTYYEVVSGESIAARPEIQKLLEDIFHCLSPRGLLPRIQYAVPHPPLQQVTSSQIQPSENGRCFRGTRTLSFS